MDTNIYSMWKKAPAINKKEKEEETTSTELKKKA